MEVSLVIPLYNEAESLPELMERIHQSLSLYTFKVIFIDDGSHDNSWEVIKDLKSKYPQITAVRFAQNFGKSAALSEGFSLASGNYVVTLDADLQDFPEEIPAMLNKIKEEDLDLLSGWKQQRKDPVFTKNIPSKLFNSVARRASGLDLHDFNCGLKVMKISLAKDLKLHSDMHRYIPVLASKMGYKKIQEKKVKHTARQYGKSKFGTNRFINGFLDLLTLIFVSRFGAKPMHFFGALGTLIFALGFLSAFVLGVSKLYAVYIGVEQKLVTDNPFFYLSLVSMILGTQLFLAGFLGEIVIRQNPNTKSYLVKETI
ncbi:MAG: glycosyltransferase [Flavobacteriaceae bacterium]|nr:MAG: glycosyltransferase [Flavobacteriaceae bacterium]